MKQLAAKFNYYKVWLKVTGSTILLHLLPFSFWLQVFLRLDAYDLLWLTKVLASRFQLFCPLLLAFLLHFAMVLILAALST